MAVDDIITAITGYPYDQLYKTLPEDIDREKVVCTYEEIIRDCLTNRKPQKSPLLINVSGIPGSGKSTFCRNLANMAQYRDALYIGFDAIMENASLPYADEAPKNPEEAFRRWELSARIAGYELLKRATKKQYAIIFDHSSALPQHVSLFESLVHEGYIIHFRHIATGVEEAKQRVMGRRRYVPPAYIDDRNAILQKLLPVFKKICTTFKEIKP